MAVIIDGTLGVTTPTGTGDVSVGDDLIFTGTGNRITGDFSTIPHENKVLFQTSITNGATVVSAIPNGTNSISQWRAYNGTSPDNAAYIAVIANSTSQAQIVSGITGTGTYLPMTFLTGGSERVRIDTSGNVSINTTSAGYRLFVNGTLRTQGDFTLSNSTGQKIYPYYATSTNHNYIGAEGDGSISFGTGTSGVSERMRIDSSGNLLVGTTSKLSGGVTGIDINVGTLSGITLGLSGVTKGFFYAVGSGVKWETNFGTIVNVVSGGSGGVTLSNGATSWSAISDERIKDIIEPISDAANKVASLRAVIGKYKTDEDGVRRAFLIAQDVQAVLPEAVNKQNDEIGTLGLQYTDTIPLLVAAIKEQQAIIKSLQDRITALEQA